MRFGGLILLIGLLSALPVAGQEPFKEFDGYSHYPILNTFYPDTNFIFHSYGFPTSATVQVMANGHLYVAMGCYIKIFEIQEDGTLDETGSFFTKWAVRDLDHDTNYLYVSLGCGGLEIYDGSNYSNPSLIGIAETELMQNLIDIRVYGDSLYGVLYPAHSHPVIIDVSDRANPEVVCVLEEFQIASAIKPCKYSDYLIVPIAEGSDRLLGIIDLHGPSGGPELIASLDILSPSQWFAGMEIYVNRLYILSSDHFQIFEFTDGPVPHHRSTVEATDYLLEAREVELDGTRYAFMCSGYSFIYKVNMNDVYNPVVVDSIIEDGENEYRFSRLQQNGNYSYCLSKDVIYQTQYPGVFVYDWEADPESRQIDSENGYSKCLSVAVKDNVVYAGTEHEGFLTIDVTNKDNPQVLGGGELQYPGRELKVDRERLYGVSINRIDVYDISNELYPEHLCIFELPLGSYIHDFEVQNALFYGRYYYAWPNGPNYLLIIDFANPVSPEILYDSLICLGIGDIHLNYPALYWVDRIQWRVKKLDISEPSFTFNRGNINISDVTPGVVISNNGYLYIRGLGILVYRLITPFITQLAEQLQDYGMQHAGFGNDKLFCFGTRADAENDNIYVFDTDVDPVNPSISGYYGYAFYTSSDAIDFTVDWPYLYCPGNELGMAIIEYTGPTGIEENEEESLPNETMLTAFPNPFNSTVKFSINSSIASDSRLNIYDVTGRLVKSIALGLPSAIYWDGTDNRGNDVASGVYFARFKDKQMSETVKVVLLR